jgi:hypothetical protein
LLARRPVHEVLGRISVAADRKRARLRCAKRATFARKTIAIVFAAGTIELQRIVVAASRRCVG